MHSPMNPPANVQREAALLAQLIELIAHHRGACAGYARVLDAIGHTASRRYERLADLPWLPVRLFKTHRLSASGAQTVATLTSSGTTGTGASQIALDRAAMERQRHLLAQTLENLIGPRRLPMLIVDTPASVRSERASIRGATVLGVMQAGRDHVFALDADQNVDADALDRFLARHAHAPFLIFGFTGPVWTRLYAHAARRALDLSNGVLLHTGGWKKLASQAVSPERFRADFRAACGLARCHNFYGMVEQGGTIHVESASGDGLYSPPFADVIVRDPQTWREAAIGVPGVLEVLSTAPRTHPGHILLTEDLGVIHGIDDGEWPGKRFSVLGRLPKAEARGCSDTAPDAPASAARAP